MFRLRRGFSSFFPLSSKTSSFGSSIKASSTSTSISPGFFCFGGAGLASIFLDILLYGFLSGKIRFGAHVPEKFPLSASVGRLGAFLDLFTALHLRTGLSFVLVSQSWRCLAPPESLGARLARPG